MEPVFQPYTHDRADYSAFYLWTDYYTATEEITGPYTGYNKGFDLAGKSTSLSTPYEDVAYGLYKVHNTYNDAVFYLDLRDGDYGATGSPDFNLKYDGTNNIYEWKRGLISDPIYNNTVVRIWEIFGKTKPNTTNFPTDFWVNELYGFASTGNHPFLTWTACDAEGTLLYYRVKRKHEGASSFTTIATLLSTVFEYEDTQVNINNGPNPGSDVYYIVEAVYSGFTKTTSAVTFEKPGEIIAKENLAPVEFSLEQNYPNPFNPSTVINYSVAERSNVVINVYNSLGSRVAELVNGVKEKGNYNVTFNAKNLSSGVYFYTIQANDFTSTKKAILLK